MAKFMIEGGHSLNGTVAIGGSKHSAVSMIVGALLTDDPIEIHNVPNILDVKYACSYVGELGRKVSWPKKNTVRISGHPFGLLVSHAAKKLRYSLLGMAMLICSCLGDVRWGIAYVTSALKAWGKWGPRYKMLMA